MLIVLKPFSNKWPLFNYLLIRVNLEPIKSEMRVIEAI